MAYAIHIEINASDAAAGRTAEWLSAFYPEVAVDVDGSSIQLASENHDEGRLRLIWLTSLANERLLARGAAGRTAVFTKLVE